MTASPTVTPATTPGLQFAVIVTFRSANVVAALASAMNGWLTKSPNTRLVVLDNSDSQPTIDIVHAMTRANADRVAAAVNSSNTGFAPAVNVAVEMGRKRWGQPEIVILVNPDVLTDVETLCQVPRLLDDPTIGVAAPLLLDAHGRDTDRGVARRFWNRRLLFAEVLGAPGVATILASRSRNIPVRRGGGVVDVDITSGAFMAIRADVFGDGLDVRLPMYLEDQEICHRAARLGLRVVVARHVVARHVGGASRRSNTAMARQLRMMELASAPCLSLNDTSGHSLGQLRWLVAFAGAARLAVATVVRVSAGAVSERARTWAGEQMILARWFVGWARNRRGLDGAASWTG